MILYKAVYVRPDGSSYFIWFTCKGTRYEILTQASKLKNNIEDAIVYVRTKDGVVI